MRNQWRHLTFCKVVSLGSWIWKPLSQQDLISGAGKSRWNTRNSYTQQGGSPISITWAPLGQTLLQAKVNDIGRGKGLSGPQVSRSHTTKDRHWTQLWKWVLKKQSKQYDFSMCTSEASNNSTWWKFFWNVRGALVYSVMRLGFIKILRHTFGKKQDSSSYL